MTLAAGAPLGTGGLTTIPGFLAVDLGLLDHRVENFYVNPSRYPGPTFPAVCPYEYFGGANRDALLARIRDPARPGEAPAGEPRCRTMAVDVAGTAKGVWAGVGVTGKVAGNETRFITLADYPHLPQERLALSLGPGALGARVEVVPRTTFGQENRAFDEVTGNGALYCYFSGEAASAQSWFVSLAAGGTLRVERIQHAPGASPCAADPGAWAFGAGAMSFVR